MRHSLFLTSLCFATSMMAFDFGSVVNAVAPAIVQSQALPSVPLTSNVTSNPLISTLTSSLGVSPLQAAGGTAILLNDAKSSMKPTDFSALTKQMPQVSTLMNAVPSNVLGTGDTTSKFANLGMDSGMVAKFKPLLIQYLQTGTKPGLTDIVQKALAN